MKTSLKLIVIILGVVMGTVPALAEVVDTEKPFSVIQFSALPENRGLSGRLLDRKYEEYRQGRLPKVNSQTRLR